MKKSMVIAVVIPMTLFGTLVGTSLVWADGDDRGSWWRGGIFSSDDDNRRYRQERGDDSYRRNHDDDDRYIISASAEDRLYRQECGSCHIAYPPQMLSAKSWNLVMGNLGDHFGDDASVGVETGQRLTEILERNAKSRWSWDGEVSPVGSITESAYFRDEHDEIPRNWVGESAKITSWGACQECHQGADHGDFSEDRVVISGYGCWDD